MRGSLQTSIVPVPYIDTLVASQSSYTKVLASGGSFQDVCGELIGVVQDSPVQSLPFISIFHPRHYSVWCALGLGTGTRSLRLVHHTSV